MLTAGFAALQATIYLCLMDIASGMDYLHSLGVLHGDVKGANVLLKTTAPTAYDPRGFVCKVGRSYSFIRHAYRGEPILPTPSVSYSMA